MNKDIKLGIALGKLKETYMFSSLVDFLKGDNSTNGNIYFHELKPLYDEYGYNEVNEVILELSKEANNE